LKALVLAGGFGTRLRPLSCTRSKMLFPIANKPMLDWTLERLAKNNITEVVLAVNYMAEAFKQRYGKKAYEMTIHHSRDSPPTPKTATSFQGPLRTAGPIKRAERLIGRRESFLVLNGDILTDINYAELVKKHRENKDATATIALYKVEDPSRYGVAEMTRKDRIERFVEKPPRGKAPSNLINAGIYALDPAVFDYIPEDKPVSIERQIFPKLARQGRLFGHEFRGFWIDIGEPADCLMANKVLLGMQKKNKTGKNVVLKGGAEIREPSVVGDGVKVGEGAKIGPHVSLGDRVNVGKGARIGNSIIFPGTTISEFTTVKGAIIGETVIVGKHVKIDEGCIIGDQAIIQDNVTLTRGVTVCPSREVSESVLTPKCLM